MVNCKTGGLRVWNGCALTGSTVSNCEVSRVQALHFSDSSCADFPVRTAQCFKFVLCCFSGSFCAVFRDHGVKLFRFVLWSFSGSFCKAFRDRSVKLFRFVLCLLSDSFRSVFRARSVQFFGFHLCRFMASICAAINGLTEASNRNRQWRSSRYLSSSSKRNTSESSN